MRRRVRENPQLEALREERDHLRIQIHLLNEKGGIHAQSASSLWVRLREMDKEIRQRQRDPNR